MAKGQWAATTEFNINYLNPVTTGGLVGEARIINMTSPHRGAGSHRKERRPSGCRRPHSDVLWLERLGTRRKGRIGPLREMHGLLVSFVYEHGKIPPSIRAGGAVGAGPESAVQPELNQTGHLNRWRVMSNRPGNRRLNMGVLATALPVMPRT
jgi:hypothetical protein